MNPARPTVRGAGVLALAVLAVGIGACSADPDVPQAAHASATTEVSAQATPPSPTTEQPPTTRQVDHSLDDELFAAAADNDAALVRDLIARGADPQIRDADGRTALQNAERLDQDAIAVLLR